MADNSFGMNNCNFLLQCLYIFFVFWIVYNYFHLPASFARDKIYSHIACHNSTICRICRPHPRQGNIPIQLWCRYPMPVCRIIAKTSNSPHSDGKPSNAVRRSRRRCFIRLWVVAQAVPIGLFGAWCLSQSMKDYGAPLHSLPLSGHSRNIFGILHMTIVTDGVCVVRLTTKTIIKGK